MLLQVPVAAVGWAGVGGCPEWRRSTPSCAHCRRPSIPISPCHLSHQIWRGSEEARRDVRAAHSLLSKLGRDFAQFINVRDDHSTTLLHLAARQGRADVAGEQRHCIRFDRLIQVISLILPLPPLARGSAQLAPLPQSDCGCRFLIAFCCRFPGSTSLHLAARSGNLDCI